MFYQILLKNKNKMTDRLYTYSYSESIKRGCRVIVPFGKGNRLRMGIVVGDIEQPDLGKIKEISKVLDKEPIVEDELIQIAFFMVKEYLSDLSNAMQTVMPPGDFSDIVEYFYYLGEKKEPFFEYLKEKKSWEEIQDAFPISYKNLTQLVIDGELELSLDRKTNLRQKTIRLVKFSKSIEEIHLSKNARAQRKIIDYLKNHEETEYSTLLKETGVTSSAVKSLENKGYLSLTEKKVYREIFEEAPAPYEKIIFNEKQREIYEKILKNFHEEKKNKFLLHGVTGSGKTEIYLQLAEEALKEGKGSIILVPEISLTPQTIARFSGRFPGKVAVLHSKLSLNERFDQWKQIQSGKFSIVIGARSAIFAPIKNLGLIVVDEEHELSFISEQNPKYDAIEIGEFRSDYHKAILLLGSATPDINHYYQALHEDYQLLEMKKRANAKPLPEMVTIDMRDEMKQGNFSMFSESLKEEIENNLENKEQTLLFLNKRGHTSYIFCRRCGYVMSCDQCDIAMTYHKGKRRLICHLCGRTKVRKNQCPNCGSKAIKDFGAGTEKLEEEAKKLFPDAVIRRIDSDSMGFKGSHEKLYQEMLEGKIDILIGTQMIAKGLDFSNLTLVGVIAADISLNQGSYRASERTFQLLTQVAGRAGRGEKSGKVIIQSYKPEHFSIQKSLAYDYQGFYEEEIHKRKQFKYPPFYDLVNIKITHENRYQCRERIFKLAEILQKEFLTLQKEFYLSGPNPCPIERINNRFRFELTYKFLSSQREYKEILRKVLNENHYKLEWRGFQLTTTINPVSFF